MRRREIPQYVRVFRTPYSCGVCVSACLVLFLCASVGGWIALGLLLYYQDGGWDVSGYNVTCACEVIQVDPSPALSEPDNVYSSFAFLGASLLLFGILYFRSIFTRIQVLQPTDVLYITFVSFLCASSVGYHLWPGQVVADEFDRWVICLFISLVCLCQLLPIRLELSLYTGYILWLIAVGILSWMTFVYPESVVYILLGILMVCTWVVETYQLFVEPRCELFLLYGMMMVLIIPAFICWFLEIPEQCQDVCPDSPGILNGHMIWHILLGIFTCFLYEYIHVVSTL